MTNTKQKPQDTLVKLKDVDIVSEQGRTLFQGLHLELSYEKVAVIGRNGVGKSTLLEVLSGRNEPHAGTAEHCVKPWLVKQALKQEGSSELSCWLEKIKESNLNRDDMRLAASILERSQFQQRLYVSHGEQRKLELLRAKIAEPELLLLDEPTQDLDTNGLHWLRSWLLRWKNGLIVVSHDRELLQDFEHFFIVAENGCRYFSGTFSALLEDLEQEREVLERQYVRNLQRLTQQEEHIHHTARRRRRKKQFGRINEIKRASPRATLNQKRDYAQVKHGRMKKVRDARIDALRKWTTATRRALHVRLPMQIVVPELPMHKKQPIATLMNISAYAESRKLFSDLNLTLRHDKIALLGGNGAGKTTLLKILMKQQLPASGSVNADYARIGYIAQSAENWMLRESVMSYLFSKSDVASLDDLTAIILSHKFPIALAERPLVSLSPGERLRAALICLFHGAPTVELLILDEPTSSLDILGQSALAQILNQWPGGLMVATHDRAFLEELTLTQTISL